MMTMDENEPIIPVEEHEQTDNKWNRRVAFKRLEIIVSSVIVLLLITINQGQKLFLFDFMSDTYETDGLRTLFSTKLVGYLIYGFLLFILIVSIIYPELIKKNPSESLQRKWFDFFDLIGVVPIFLMAVVILNSYFYSPAIVHGPSMEPTFYEGNVVIIRLEQDPYQTNEVVIYDRGDALLIKRIVAVAGDTLVVDETGVTINGALMDYEGNEWQYHNYNGVIPDNMYFLVGDNDAYSNDSRYFGLVSEDDLLGEVVFTFNNGRDDG